MGLLMISLAGKAQILLSESFEGTFPPTGWILVNAGTGNSWTQNTTASGVKSGTKSMTYAYSVPNAANAWAFSSTLALTAGTNYKISYWYKARSSSFPEKLKVTVGDAQTVAAATTVLATHSPITSTTFAESIVTYSPIATGNYYLGFNCFSDANEFNLYVDSIVVQVAVGCSGAPAVGTITAPVTICSGVPFDLVNTGAGSDGGLKFSWQKSSNNVNWTNMNNTSFLASPYTTSQTAATYYRLVDTCTASGLSAISNVVQVSINSASTATDPADEDIFNVTIGSLNNSSTCTTTGGTGSTQSLYSNYTALAPTVLSRTLAYPFSIQIGTCNPSGTWTNNTAIYIDFNQNGSFTDAGEQVYLTSAITNGAHIETGSVTIPAGALLGNTKMRVMNVETITPTSITPCGSYSWGETEDYTVTIAAPPACLPVSGIVVSTRQPNFMIIDWNVGAGSAGYEYVIDQAAADPAGAGTVVGTNQATAFGSFDPNTLYYVHVRSNCGANGLSNWAKAASIPCVTAIAPTDGATNVSITPTFNWTPVTGVTDYAIYFSTDNGTTYSDGIPVPAPPVDFMGFDYSSTYTWFVRAIKGADSSNYSCGTSNSASFITVSPPPPPVNDICANAINLSVSNGFCSTPLLGTLTSADTTAGLGVAACSAGALKNDVWYKATVPASGKITVQTSAVNTTVTDLVVQAYSGTCGALTTIGCDDDNNPDPSPSSLHSKLGLSGRTPGEVIYYRVMPYDAASQGAFAICAFDTTSTVMPAVATGVANGCTTATTVIIDSAWKFTYITLKDAGGNVIGQIYPNGSLLGSTTASFYKNSGAVRKDGNNIYYLDRNLTITPQTQPIGQVITRMFFTDAELVALAAVTGGATRAQLNSSKTQQSCATSALAANGKFFTQFASGAYGTNHFVEIVDTSYSTFYFHKGNVALPVNYAELTGVRNGNKVDLTWVTKSEINNKGFEIERSADGRAFSVVGKVTTKAAGGNSTLPITYNFADVLPLATTNYYRLKQTDIDGRITYSNTVLVKGLKPAVFTLNTLFPNPAKERITAAMQSPFAGDVTLVITDITGKIIKQQVANMAVGDNLVTIDIALLPSGTYILKGICNNGCETANSKFTKQ